MVEVEAAGYEWWCMTEGGLAVEPGVVPMLRLFPRSREVGVPRRVVIEMLRAPAPAVEVIVPAGFTGPIEIRRDVSRVADLEADGRTLRLRHVPGRELAVPLTRYPLMGITPALWTYRFEDGRPIPVFVTIHGAYVPEGDPSALAVREVQAMYGTAPGGGEAWRWRAWIVPESDRP